MIWLLFPENKSKINRLEKIEYSLFCIDHTIWTQKTSPYPANPLYCEDIRVKPGLVYSIIRKCKSVL